MQAKSVGLALLKSTVKMHYNWKYKLLRQSVQQGVARYKVHHSKTQAAPTGLGAAIAVGAAGTAAANAATAAATAATAANEALKGALRVTLYARARARAARV